MGGAYARIIPGGLHRRTAPLDQRLALRMPRVFVWLRALVLGLSPASRVRRAFLARSFQVAFSNYERGDFESTNTLFYSPTIRLESGNIADVPVDAPEVAEGHGEVGRWLERWHEPFAWISYEVTEVLDFGDRMVFTNLQVGEGKASGAPVELEIYSAIRLTRDAAIVWQRFFRTRNEALSAIGVDPASVIPPPGG